MALRLLAPTVAVVVAIAVSGCGGGEEEESSPPPGPASQTFQVSEKEYSLTPSTITIQSPGTYAFKATNDGTTDHGLEIEGNGVEEEIETLAPGESGTLTVALEAGTYEMYCPISNHRDLGMEGDVSVT